MISARITGVKELDNCLKLMSPELKDSTLQAAGLRAAKPLVTKAKLLAPEGPTGNLVDSIDAIRGSKGSFSRGERTLGAVTAGPVRRKGGNHGHLVEYGTVARYTKGKGGKRKVVNAYRGVMKAKPFMRPAFESTQGQIRAIYNQEVATVILRVMKRTLKAK